VTDPPGRLLFRLSCISAAQTELCRVTDARTMDDVRSRPVATGRFEALWLALFAAAAIAPVTCSSWVPFPGGGRRAWTRWWRPDMGRRGGRGHRRRPFGRAALESEGARAPEDRGSTIQAMARGAHPPADMVGRGGVT
jgi:hypothetical protein